MNDGLTPRQMVRGLLQGIAPPRPLVLPIVFSLGARVENVPLHTFLSNPTKISNSVRRIRSHLHSDGVTCYFDPFLEAEALGIALKWETEDQPPALQRPASSRTGELPDGLRSTEEALKSGRVGVAVEVIHRLSALRQDDSILMAGVTGPFTLAVRLTGLDHQEMLPWNDLPNAAVELAASMATQVSSAFVEAGANLIFVQEEVLPVPAAESCEAWAALLAPIFNIIRFYEALPVLQFPCPSSLVESAEVIFRGHWDCVICPLVDWIWSQQSGRKAELKGARLGVALPRESFLMKGPPSEEDYQSLRQVISELRPAILTTAGDIPASTDMQRLTRILESVPRTI
jgi:hypothetical protein